LIAHAKLDIFSSIFLSFFWEGYVKSNKEKKKVLSKPKKKKPPKPKRNKETKEKKNKTKTKQNHPTRIFGWEMTKKLRLSLYC
jgi:hypothetical protein